MDPCVGVPSPGPHARDVVAQPGARHSSSSSSSSSSSQPAGKGTGQGSNNGGNEVARALKALDDNSVASDKNFYDINK